MNEINLNTLPPTAKYGAVLSRSNAKEITGALQTLIKMLKRAGAWDDAITADEEPAKAAEILNTDDRAIAYGDSIKSYGKAQDGREIIGGYLAVWGSPQKRDLHKQYFTKATDFEFVYPTNPLPALYHHGLSDDVGTTITGEIFELTKDDTGLAVKAYLGLSMEDMREWEQSQIVQYQEYIDAVKRLVGKDVLRWSGGALPQGVMNDDDGFIRAFPLIEGSLTFSPAEPSQETRVTALKSMTVTAFRDALAAHKKPLPVATKPITTKTLDTEGLKTMNPQEVAAAVIAKLREMGVEISEETAAALVEAMMPATEAASAEVKADNAEMTDEEKKKLAEEQKSSLVSSVVKAVLSLQSKAAAENAAQKAAQLVLGGQPNSKAGAGYQDTSGRGNGQANKNTNVQVTTPYDRLSVDEMSYLHTFMSGVEAIKHHRAYQPKPEFLKALAYKIERESGKHDGNGAPMYDDSVMKSVQFIKANELDNTGASLAGIDWVPTLWTDRLWERMRLDNVVLPQLATIDMPSNPYNIPIESSDPTVYKVPETTAETQLVLATSASVIPDSVVSTAKVVLTADKLALRVGISHEETEDSIIPFLAQATRQAQRAIEDAVDNVILNGDSATSANINYDGGTPGATDKFMVAFPGIFKLPLVTATGLSLSMGGAAPTLTKVRAIRALLLNAYAARISDLVYFCDFPTYMKLLSLDELLTVDKYGSNATVLTGEVGRIDNIPVLVSNEIALSALSNGKVSSTGDNNLYGRLALVHKPSFYFGYRRRISPVVEFLSYYDAYQLTVTVRPALVRRDTSCASILYGIGV